MGAMAPLRDHQCLATPTQFSHAHILRMRVRSKAANMNGCAEGQGVGGGGRREKGVLYMMDKKNRFWMLEQRIG